MMESIRVNNMKTLICSLLLVALFTGCSSPKTVAQMQGAGTAQVFTADYNRVWSAAVAASQMGDLYILQVDKTHGFISAKRGLRPETFGENVAIWVRGTAPNQTQVEVVSRQAGPPVLVLRNWEQRILTSIQANLTTEITRN